MWRVKLNQRPITAPMVFKYGRRLNARSCSSAPTQDLPQPQVAPPPPPDLTCTLSSSPHAESQRDSELNRDLMRDAFPLYCGVRDLPQHWMIGLGEASVTSHSFFREPGLDIDVQQSRGSSRLTCYCTHQPSPWPRPSCLCHIQPPLYPLLVHWYVRLDGLYY